VLWPRDDRRLAPLPANPPTDPRQREPPTVVFFGKRQLKPSLGYMAAFWASIAASIASFHPISPLASLLFAPTQVWVTIAAKLNWDIVKLNEGKTA